MRTLSCSMWSPVPRPGIATRPLPQGRGVLAPAPQGKPPARSYTGSLLSVRLPGVLRVSSLFSHLHTCPSAILPLLPETHGPLSGGWSRGLSQEWKTSFQWSDPHPRVHRVEAERDPTDPAPDITGSLSRGGSGLSPLQGSYWSPLDSTRNLTSRYLPPSSFL